jgi:hypothetical protein
MGKDREGNKAHAGRVWLQASFQPILSTGRDDSYAEVFVGVEKVMGVPRAGFSNTSIFVETECSDLLHTETMKDGPQSTSVRPIPDLGGTPDHWYHEGGRILEKINLLRAAKVSAQDVAKVLEISPELVSALDNPAYPIENRNIFKNSGHAQIEWEQGFRFLVKDPQQAVLTFNMKGVSTDAYAAGEVKDLGNAELLLANYLDRTVQSQQTEITKGMYGYEDQRRTFRITLGMKDFNGNPMSLLVTVRIGFFMSSGIAGIGR